MTWLTNAVAYARAGYDVFPCCPGTKRPIPENGFHSATRDAKTLTRWGLDHPDANLAVRTGRRVSVVDLDANAAELWFEDAMGKAGLDFGPIVWTPRGGLHVWFADPDGRVRCRAAKVDDTHPLAGFDVKGAGGYIVCAPSRTAEGVYGWVAPGDLPPAIDTLPPWPEAVVPADPRVHVEGARPRIRVDDDAVSWGYVEAALRSELEAVESAVPGTRNETLNRAAFNLGRFPQLDRATLEDVLVEAAIRAGLPEREARCTTRSGLKATA